MRDLRKPQREHCPDRFEKLRKRYIFSLIAVTLAIIQTVANNILVPFGVTRMVSAHITICQAQ